MDFISCASKKITTLIYLSVESHFYLYIDLKYITVRYYEWQFNDFQPQIDTHLWITTRFAQLIEANPDRIIGGTTRRVVTSVANPNRRASIIRSTIERFHPLSCVS